MKFPYGIADFYKIRQEGYTYVDRTHFISQVEERGSQLIFLRPPRFGKSLWLSTLANYYDVARADDFAWLFGDLSVGQNPTPRHNQYFILRWDFSKVPVFGDVKEIAQALYGHLNDRIAEFGNRYAAYVSHPIVINSENAISSFESLLSALYGQPYKLYLFIDEYDNFANEVAMGSGRSNDERYAAMVQGDGVLKTVFKNVKAAMGEGRLDRVFVTGVSPMLLSDLTSGFNTAVDISLERSFHDLCGFSEAEVTTPLEQIAVECNLSPEQRQAMLDLMRIYYNGYTFHPDAQRVIYNPTLSFYFLDALQREYQAPSEMLDVNLSMDKNKLEYIASRPGGERLIQTLLAGQPEVGTPRVVDRFGLKDLVKPAMGIESLASLLFYYKAVDCNAAPRGTLGATAIKLSQSVNGRCVL